MSHIPLYDRFHNFQLKTAFFLDKCNLDRVVEKDLDLNIFYCSQYRCCFQISRKLFTLRSGGVLNIIGRIYYLSYRCAGQYKNFKNFSNLCNHEQDFCIKAEWHFLASSYGKGPYDGIWGTLKQNATMFAFKHPYVPFILNGEDLYNHLKNVVGISVLY